MIDAAIPVLPARSLDETIAFYARFGFVVGFRQDQPAPYAILGRGMVELHFFGFPDLRPSDSYAGCYLRVNDVDKLHRDWSRVGLPATGIPRLGAVRDEPWGMREFALVDPNGNLVRVGEPVALSQGETVVR
ncbi:MAG TPA: VOC family protein [Gemmataceae bacterium]|nr:VOC family protein [Gemmataceae bacterium]